MKRPRNEIQLQLAGSTESLILSLSSTGSLESKLGNRSMGTFKVEKKKTSILLRLAEIVLLDAPKRTYLRDSVLTEIAGLRIVHKGKRANYRFQRTGAPAMPPYLRLMALEMSGLVKW